MRIFSCFQAWHTYLNQQVELDQLSLKVFTINNHYLLHLQHIIQMVGPLKAYSCRSLERTIGKFSNITKGRINVGVNASKVLSDNAHYNSLVIRGVYSMLTRNNYNQNSFISHPSGDRTFPQLWEPFIQETLGGEIDERLSCAELTKFKIVEALQAFYKRNYGFRNGEVLDSDILIAGRSWKDSLVISSTMYRMRKRSKTRANNIVLFEAKINRYIMNKRKFWKEKV